MSPSLETCTTPLLDAVGLGRRHPESPDWLFQNINLEISSGDRLALIGPTGSGKSLVLRALALLDPVDVGEVLWSGESITDTAVPEFRSRVLYLQQLSPVIEGTVEENLRIPYTLRLRQDLAFPIGRAVELMKILGRDKTFLAAPTANLSGGERQIVALLRVLLVAPTILLLDEPSAALDPQATTALERLVAAWYQEAPRTRAYIWVSHDPAQAERVANRVIRIEDGGMEAG
jgi:putative ABC transport system ATP-binding protein